MREKRGYIWLSGVLMICIYFLSCSHTSVSDDTQQLRSVASELDYEHIAGARYEALLNEAKIEGGQLHFPSGLNEQEKFDLWHLSEGSEIFPLKWFLNIRSLTLKDKAPTYLNQNLDKKFGVVFERDAKDRYPIKWIGLTATWTDVPNSDRDVRLESHQTINDIAEATSINGTKSIAMTGVNCTFCHSTEINILGKNHFVEGAPNMLDIRGFFQDELGSVAQTMLIKDNLKEYLEKIKYQDEKHRSIEEVAQDFSNGFRQELHLLPEDIGKQLGIREDRALQSIERHLKNVLSKIEDHTYPDKLEERKVDLIKKMFFEHRSATAKYLVSFLKMTYGLKDSEVSNEMKLRMKWLADAIGQDPNIPTAIDGYGRTDAFGRISNLVARFKNPIALTASTSVPPMWNIQYRAMFHWNANTNSIVMRNLGQSFGLGAILLPPETGVTPLTQFNSTANLSNVLKLESLIYKIQMPQWTEIAEPKVDREKVIAGCNLYRKNCAGCHQPEHDRVGPTQELVNYKVPSVQKVGTDEIYLVNQSTPVEGVPFRTALFGFTMSVRENFYRTNNVSTEVQAQEEHISLRGTERFRDTYLGEHSYTGAESYMNTHEKPGNQPGYVARPLAGAWATAPYLHNGSVPTIYDLLAPESERPHIFFTGSREYDTQKLGFRSDRAQLPTEFKDDETACKKFPERCLNVSLTGNSNKGHSGPGFTISDPTERMNLIEFLKVIRPEAEYSRNLPLIYSVGNDGQCFSLEE